MAKKLVHFDWAMKKMLRYKANFDILEGFLSELLGEEVKIKQVLDIESNKEAADDKFNRVGMHSRGKREGRTRHHRSPKHTGVRLLSSDAFWGIKSHHRTYQGGVNLRQGEESYLHHHCLF
jgi:hypothetical protein